MSTDPIRIRPARPDEAHALQALHDEAVRGLGLAFYTAEQLEAYLEHVGTYDPRILDAGTYWVAEQEGQLLGCGGWSDRGPAYGDDGSGQVRVPGKDPAVMRSFYVRPASAGRGIATTLLSVAEAQAVRRGFVSAELAASLTAVSLYERAGYRAVEQVTHDLPGAIQVETVWMHKASLEPAD